MPTPPPSAGNVWNKGPPGTSTGGSGSTAASNGTGLPQDLLQFSTQPNRVESLFNGHSGMHFPSLFSSDPICSKINMDHSRDTHLKFIICPNLNPIVWMLISVFGPITSQSPARASPSSAATTSAPATTHLPGRITFAIFWSFLFPNNERWMPLFF